MRAEIRRELPVPGANRAGETADVRARIGQNRVGRDLLTAAIHVDQAETGHDHRDDYQSQDEKTPHTSFALNDCSEYHKYRL